MRTATGVIVGAILMWCWLAIWHGASAWIFTRIPPSTHPDCRPRIRVYRHGIEQVGASWPG